MNSIVINIIGELIMIYEGETCAIYLPIKPHISPKDGGHLMVIPKRIVSERGQLMPYELLELDFFSIVASKILYSVHNTDWINYQENGNWSLNTTGERRLHLHVYGRKRSATEQPFGESLSFPLKKDLDKWKVEPYKANEIKSVQEIVPKIILEDWTKEFLVCLKAIKNS